MTDRVRQQESISDLEEGLQIDENALDEALAQQPDLYHRVSKELSLLISQRDAAEQAFEDEKAKSDSRLRSLAKKSDDKLAEGAIKAQTRLHPEVKKSREIYLHLCAKVGLYTALEKSFQQRSYALGHLVSLYVAGYFGNLTPNSKSSSMKDHTSQLTRQAMNRVRRGIQE
jgi:CRP-like cAMP-binding protein